MTTSAQILPAPRPVQDSLLLVARVILGVIFMAHGAQKFFEWTLAGTGAAFAEMGIPLPQVAATFAAIVEFGAGALLILGLFTPIAAALTLVVTVGAWLMVHLSNGIMVANNGWELVAALALGALVFVAVGPGRFSLDALIARRRSA
ncbi:DoxX family protein [Citricoccus sp. SGAir0253]|uniref:DoxX family protein n=1 Tax=Citricoccus sp. SGAir0253 TaxID=2567881 RepID=UPI001FEF194D|nr:DoxX family protein [Citricoccus sp. SGAir0253]